MLAALEAEGAGHAAAAGLGLSGGEADGTQYRDFLGHAHSRLLVAVAVQDGRGGQAAGQHRFELVRVRLHECAQAHGHLVELSCARVRGKQVHQFVVEDGLA